MVSLTATVLMSALAPLWAGQLPGTTVPPRPAPIAPQSAPPSGTRPATRPATPAALKWLPNPKTWDEVMRGLHREVRKVRNTTETWALTTEFGGQKQTMVTTRTLNGSLARVRSTLEGRNLMEYGYDGKDAFFVIYPDKVYGRETGPNQAFAAAYQAPPQKELEDGTFLFQFNGLYDLMIVTKPALRITVAERTTLGGKPARRIVARASNPKSKGQVEVTVWLAPDVDRLMRAEARGQGKEGPALRMTLVRTAFNPAAKFTPATFRLAPATIRGFQRVAWPG